MHFILGQCGVAFEQHSSIMLTLLLAGLVGGFTHCVGMCGPFVIAQCDRKVNAKNNDTHSHLQRLSSNLLWPYHLGRMTTYIALGIIASFLSKQVIGTPIQQFISVVFLSLAGVIFIGTALPKKPSILKNIKLSFFTNIISKIAKVFMRNPVGVRGYALGVLLGFLPCGLIFAALMVAATTANPFSAGIAMALFALGTIPALLIVEFGGVIVFRKWPKLTQNITRIVMVFNGISLFALAAKVVW